jgi:hypothetical protein
MPAAIRRRHEGWHTPQLSLTGMMASEKAAAIEPLSADTPMLIILPPPPLMAIDTPAIFADDIFA